jgi:hypothetical protein
MSTISVSAFAAVGRRALPSVALLLPLLVAMPAKAQDPGAELRGIVLDDGGAPLPFANVVVPALQRSVLADAGGRFAIRDLPPGSHELLFRQIGFSPVRRPYTTRAPGSATADTIRLTRLALLLDPVVVVSDPACTQGGFDAAQGPQVGVIFDMAQQNAEQYRLLATQYPVRYRLTRMRRFLKKGGAVAGENQDTLVQRSDERTPYVAGEVLAMQGGSLEFRVPSAADIAEPAFQAAHCFRYAGTDTVGGQLAHKVEFMPTGRVTTPDVSGALYLDARTGLLRRGVFRLVQLPARGIHVTSFEVTTSYREVQPYLLVPASVSTAQGLRNVDFRGMDVVRQTDERSLLDYAFVGATPGTGAATSRGTTTNNEGRP